MKQLKIVYGRIQGCQHWCVKLLLNPISVSPEERPRSSQKDQTPAQEDSSSFQQKAFFNPFEINRISACLQSAEQGP